MNIFDSRLARALPDFTVRGIGIVRVGWNFRPDWDRSLRQPWVGRGWVWLGPYVVGNVHNWGEQP